MADLVFAMGKRMAAGRRGKMTFCLLDITELNVSVSGDRMIWKLPHVK
jgi:hypothetical protein